MNDYSMSDDEDPDALTKYLDGVLAELQRSSGRQVLAQTFAFG